MRSLPLVFALVVACATPPAAQWPARPFARTDEVDPAASAIHDARLRRLEAALGPYVVEGGTLLEGTAADAEHTWHVHGVRWSAAGMAGIELTVTGSSHGFVVSCEPNATECSVATSIPAPLTGRLARTTVDDPAFDVVVGPEGDRVHLALAPASTECPSWTFDLVRARMAQEPGFTDADGRYAYVEEVDDGTLVSNDGVTCCYRVTHATTRSWIETRCPGRFGVDVVAAEPEQRCAPCGSPPAGCH
jgi:hypothetical protein